MEKRQRANFTFTIMNQRFFVFAIFASVVL